MYMSETIHITDAAAKYIGEILKENLGTALVVGFDNKGCGGHKYTFALCYESEIPSDVDSVTIPSGRVVLAPNSINGLRGATLDLYDDLFEQKLFWNNPMAVSSCGCGDSFSLDGESSCGSQ